MGAEARAPSVCRGSEEQSGGRQVVGGQAVRRHGGSWGSDSCSSPRATAHGESKGLWSLNSASRIFFQCPVWSFASRCLNEGTSAGITGLPFPSPLDC